MNQNLDVAVAFNTHSAFHALLVCRCTDRTVQFLQPHDGQYRFLREGQVVSPRVLKVPVHLFYIPELRVDILLLYSRFSSVEVCNNGCCNSTEQSPS